MNKPYIVIADDDPDDRDLFADAAADTGARVKSVSNGAELMAALAGGEMPNMVFLDLNMPEKSGKECLSEIRADARFESLPVIIYSTSSSRRDIDDTLALGASLYWVKPNSFGRLKSVLRELVGNDWSTAPAQYLVAE
jgi:CheY-like chemotaxis protein